MTSYKVTDAAGAVKHFEVASGAGTSADPFIQKTKLVASTESIGKVVVEQSTTSALVVGQKAVTNTAAALGSSTALKYGVTVKFMSGTGPLYVGVSGVSNTSGYKLASVGNTTPVIKVDNLASIFIISDTSSGDKACFIGS